MQLRRVVTCFLLDPARGRVLLGRRSDGVSTYPGRWAAVSGSVEEATPLEQARREIREETGLEGQSVRLVSEGVPVRFAAWDLGTVWVVHPFLFHCLTPGDAAHDWEHVRFEWVQPADIESLETVPKLAEAFRAVCGFEGTPSAERLFEELRGDRERGADELGILALQGVRAACPVSGGEDVERWLARMRDTCRRAAGLRPSMASVRSAGLEAFGACRQAAAQPVGSPARAAADAIAALEGQRDEAAIAAARAGAGMIGDGSRVVTLSLSSTALMALHDAGRIAELTVAESRPLCEGRETARLAATFGIPTRLVTDAAAPAALSKADMLLFGADSVTAGGDVVNKAGTLALCCAAARFGVPAVCVTTPAKVLPEGRRTQIEMADPDELGDPLPGVEVRNPCFDDVPADLVGSVVLGGDGTAGNGLSERARRLAALEAGLDAQSPGIAE